MTPRRALSLPALFLALACACTSDDPNVGRQPDAAADAGGLNTCEQPLDCSDPLSCRSYGPAAASNCTGPDWSRQVPEEGVCGAYLCRFEWLFSDRITGLRIWDADTKALVGERVCDHTPFCMRDGREVSECTTYGSVPCSACEDARKICPAGGTDAGFEDGGLEDGG